jgi:hypothetical protein
MTELRDKLLDRNLAAEAERAETDRRPDEVVNRQRADREPDGDLRKTRRYDITS